SLFPYTTLFRSISVSPTVATTSLSSIVFCPQPVIAPAATAAVKRTTAKRFFILSKASFVFLTTLLYPVFPGQSMFLYHLTDFSRLPEYPGPFPSGSAFSAHRENTAAYHS